MGLKFLERDSFREIPSPATIDEDDVRPGSAITLNGEGWRVVGVAPNPNRPGDRLVFIERLVPIAGDC